MDDYHFNISKIKIKFVPNYVGEIKIALLEKMDIFYVLKYNFKRLNECIFEFTYILGQLKQK